MNDNLYARCAGGFVGTRRFLEFEDGRSACYADLERHTARVANVLRAHGLEPGDRVTALAAKSPQYVWLYLGCVRAGLVFHPLNPDYTASELAFFLRDAAPRLVVCDAAREARAAAAAADAGAQPPQRLVIGAHGTGTFDTACADAATDFETAARSGADDAALLYSSGTTGTPKGIRITHDNLYTNARALVAAWAVSAEDVLVHALPMFHVHGLFITLGPALLAGATLRFLPRFDPAAVLAALPGATLMAGVPTYYSRLLASPDLTRERCAGMRLFISGSAPLPETTFHAFSARTGHVILERYGMTETGIIASNPLHGERKPGSVGRALPGVEVRVVDDRGAPCAVGAIGDIEVRGASVFPGYWALPAASAEAFAADGWFKTGDQGYLDASAYLFIVGRSKDMVISGGLNVYPKEVERELEGLAEVAEAAVFGVPHADLGEAVVAACIAAPGAAIDGQALIAALKAGLAGYKVPKRIVVVPDLPRNAMGKVQKNVLRERHAGLFAANAGA